MGNVEGGSCGGESSVVKDIPFRVYGVPQLRFSVVEAEVAIGYAGGKPVVAEGHLPLVLSHQDGANLGRGILAPCRYVRGKLQEALVPGGHAILQMRRPLTPFSSTMRTVKR